MAEKKMWSQGDARAEMNRVVRSADEALKTLNRAACEIEKLGEETGFGVDAQTALRVLSVRARMATLNMTAPHGAYGSHITRKDDPSAEANLTAILKGM